MSPVIPNSVFQVSAASGMVTRSISLGTGNFICCRNRPEDQLFECGSIEVALGPFGLRRCVHEPSDQKSQMSDRSVFPPGPCREAWTM